MANARKYTDDQVQRAKEMYMDYAPIQDIAKETGLTRTSIYYYVKQWGDERELAKAELFQALSQSKKWSITNMTNSAIKIITKSLENLSKKENITLTEAKMAATILDTLDKITRLDDNRPTDIVSSQEEPITVEVIEEKLRLDPFRIPKEDKHEAN